MMNLKAPDFSTVIIVNKNQGQSKSLKVKTKHLQRLKLYFTTVVLLILALVSTIFFLSSAYSKQHDDEQRLVAQIEKLKGQMPQLAAASAASTANTNTAQGYIQSIQAKLTKITEYLNKRGLKGFSNLAVGGNGDDSKKLTEVEQYSLYNDYITRLLSGVAFTPMGYPRVSSVTSVFGFRSDPFDGSHAEFHPGMDFKGQKGDLVKCTANGKIIYAGWFGGYGNCIRISHGNSFETLYGHLSHINVSVGQSVHVGDVIGRVGSTGRTTAPHLHYEVRKNGVPINPNKFITLNN